MPLCKTWNKLTTKVLVKCRIRWQTDSILNFESHDSSMKAAQIKNSYTNIFLLRCFGLAHLRSHSFYHKSRRNHAQMMISLFDTYSTFVLFSHMTTFLILITQHIRYKKTARVKQSSITNIILLHGL